MLRFYNPHPTARQAGLIDSFNNLEAMQKRPPELDWKVDPNYETDLFCFVLYMYIFLPYMVSKTNQNEITSTGK